MLFRTGVVHAKSSKQKLNTKSYTEINFVRVSGYLPYHIWLDNFFKFQGYHLTTKTLFQDNQSAIKMEVNGQDSCTVNSPQVFVYDCVKSGKLNVVYCPTSKMLADFFTKLLQGSAFRLFCDVVKFFCKLFDYVKDFYIFHM